MRKPNLTKIELDNLDRLLKQDHPNQTLNSYNKLFKKQDE